MSNQQTSILERFQSFLDWLGKGMDILIGAIAWVVIMAALLVALYWSVAFPLSLLGD